MPSAPSPHPGEKRHQRDVAARFLAQWIQRRADDLGAQFRVQGHRGWIQGDWLDSICFSMRLANTVISLAACLSPFFSATAMPWW